MDRRLTSCLFVSEPEKDTMLAPRRPIAFVLVSTDHGTMIVNRFDYNLTAPNQGCGVGFMLLSQSSYEMHEASMAKTLLDARRRHFGDGVIALDVGANIGVFTVEWAKHMTGWGHVVSIEAQERLFHALAGNIAINNCFNAQAIFAAARSETGQMLMPVLNYLSPASFGSLELRRREQTEPIGQPVDYTDERMRAVRTVSIDSLGLQRLDMLKVDVEGMEAEVLEGAVQTIANQLPIMIVENVKADKTIIQSYLDGYGYRTFSIGMNVLAIHQNDPTADMVREFTAPAT
jgi:FkbM family methyltransferase